MKKWSPLKVRILKPPVVCSSHALRKGEQELMLNSRQLILRELPLVADFAKPNAPVYVDVGSLSRVRELAKKYDVVVPEHKTGYGTNEMILLEPGGNLVWFASQEDTEVVA